MKPATGEWVEKAEADYQSIGRERRARKSPNFDLACFCAQQCAKKYLKALLRESNRPIPKTHDLSLLISLLKKRFPEVLLLSPFSEALSSFAVAFRYPGEEAQKETAAKAHRDYAMVRDAARRLLGLSANRSRKGRRA